MHENIEGSKVLLVACESITTGPLMYVKPLTGIALMIVCDWILKIIQGHCSSFYVYLIVSF